MKKMLWLDIYDETGLKFEEVRVPADAEAIREEMVSALQADGIHVIREAISRGKPVDREKTATLTVNLEVDNIKFTAMGEVNDVLDALNDVLEAIGGTNE